MTTSRFHHPAVLAAGITLTHLLYLAVVTGAWRGGGDWTYWDSGWYASIVEHGYRSALPPVANDPTGSNVAFFPGYPAVVWLVKRLTGLGTSAAELTASALAAWGLWGYGLALLRRWQILPRLQAATVGAIIAHPAAFYLLMGYSESLFGFALIGFFYRSVDRPDRRALVGGLLGALMTATRLVGVPVVGCALIEPLLAGRVDHKWLGRALAVTLIGALGVAGFLVYCQIRFDHWDLYFWTQRVGWHVEPDYAVLFRGTTYRTFPIIKAGLFRTEPLNGLSAVLTVTWLAVVGWVEWRLARYLTATGEPATWRQRLPFYVGAALLFYIPAAATAQMGLISLFRYTLMSHLLLVFALAHLLHRHPPTRRTHRVLVVLYLLAVPLSGWIQGICAYLFTHLKWVA